MGISTQIKIIDSCQNCDKKLLPEANYCLNCGAKITNSRITLRNTATEFSEQYFNIDNTFLRTFSTMFSAPQKVINGYLNGMRRRYLNAANYFALALTLSGIQVFITTKFYPEALTPKGLAKAEQQIAESIQSLMDYQSIIFFATIPLLAMIAYIVFFTLKKHNFAEHFVIQLYAYSHCAIVSSVLTIVMLFLGLDIQMTSLLFIPLYIIYYIYTYQRIYDLTAKGLMLRTLYFLAIGFTIYVIIVISTVLLFYLTGNMNFLKPE